MNPYLIQPPARISFSGGRSSAFMLYNIWVAHGYNLPKGIEVIFANTAKEREETYVFVERCSKEWNILIHWVEYVPESPYFRFVNFQSASRQGEPFAQLIRKKRYLPNPVTRFCTTWLKIEAMQRAMNSLGYKEFDEVIGLRADEARRLGKAKNETGHGLKLYPMAEAGVTKEDVMSFWADNSFDLGLGPDEGNCDLCFLKGKQKKIGLIAKRPESALWWAQQEQETIGLSSSASGALFRKAYSYQQLIKLSKIPNIYEVCSQDDELRECEVCID